MAATVFFLLNIQCSSIDGFHFGVADGSATVKQPVAAKGAGGAEQEPQKERVAPEILIIDLAFNPPL